MSALGDDPTPVTDEQWDFLQPLLPKPTWRPGAPGGPPMDLRRVLNGMFDIHKTGSQWQMMPNDLGKGATIYGYFRRWSQSGVRAMLMEQLRQMERRMQGRLPDPSASGAESQRIQVMTPGDDVGFDGNQKVKGRKRHRLVDTRGLIVAVVVPSARMDDRHGLVALLKRSFSTGVKRLRKIWVDGGYEAQWLEDGVRELKQTHKIDLEVVERTGKGVEVIKHRGKVERTFSWICNARRKARDDEVLTSHSEAMIQLSMIRILLKRLAE